MDAAALQHDQDYGLVDAKGFNGAVVETKTILADVALVQRANKVISLYKKKAIDPYTGDPISKITLNRARKVAAGFSVLIRNKALFSGQLTDELNEDLKKERDVDSTPTDGNAISP